MLRLETPLLSFPNSCLGTNLRETPVSRTARNRGSWMAFYDVPFCFPPARPLNREHSRSKSRQNSTLGDVRSPATHLPDRTLHAQANSNGCLADGKPKRRSTSEGATSRTYPIPSHEVHNVPSGSLRSGVGASGPLLKISITGSDQLPMSKKQSTTTESISGLSGISLQTNAHRTRERLSKTANIPQLWKLGMAMIFQQRSGKKSLCDAGSPW